MRNKFTRKTLYRHWHYKKISHQDIKIVNENENVEEVMIDRISKHVNRAHNE